VVLMDVFLPPNGLDPKPAGGGHLTGQGTGQTRQRAPAEGAADGYRGRSARASSRDSRSGAEPATQEELGQEEAGGPQAPAY